MKKQLLPQDDDYMNIRVHIQGCAVGAVVVAAHVEEYKAFDGKQDHRKSSMVVPRPPPPAATAVILEQNSQNMEKAAAVEAVPFGPQVTMKVVVVVDLTFHQ